LLPTVNRILETKRSRWKRLLREKDAQLEQAGRVKSEFLATISHELRTPLTAVIGFSAALRSGLMGPISEKQRDCTGEILTSGQELLSLIDDMLDLAQGEASPIPLDLEEVDVGFLLGHAVAAVKEAPSTAGLCIDLQAAEDLGSVVLDLRKTGKIVGHLLSNAVKFGAGRCVILKARQVPRGSVGTMPDGSCERATYALPLPDNEVLDFVEISVTDHGIGISPQDLTTLFEPFSQIDDGLARRFDGTGLGLAVVRQLTEAMGGTVAVASAEGEGACFAAWLPVRTLTGPGAV
jgi:signal transduction histidine kinase